MSKRTIEQFKKEVKAIDPNFTVLSDYYKNNKEKLLFKHLGCEKTFYMNAHDFLAGNRCPHCRYKRLVETTRKNRPLLSLNDAQEKINKISNNEYTIIEYDPNTQKKSLFLHKTCGRKFYMTMNHFISAGNRCPKCSHMRGASWKRKDKDYYQNIIDNIDPTFKIIGEYKNCMTGIEIYHSVCNRTFIMPVNEIIYTERDGKLYCPECKKIEIENEISKRLEILKTKLNENIEIVKESISDLTGISSFVTLKCKKCGKTFKMDLSRIFNRELIKCPLCDASEGEAIIKYYFDTLGINYELQKTFDDCRDKGKLKFDFYLPEKNILIEYDGEFHYFPVISEEQFLDQQKKDKIKDEYCKKNNIPLIRIPYFEKNSIKVILENILDK